MQSSNSLFPLSAKNLAFNLTSLRIDCPHLIHGPKHIPIPIQTSNDEIIRSFEQAQNKILWQVYFNERPTVSKNRHLKRDDFNRNLHQFQPPPTPDHPLSDKHGATKIFHNHINRLVADYLYDNPSQRYTSPETKSLRDIVSKNPSVIAVPADKNLGLCWLDIRRYNSLVMAHLGNQSNYEFICDIIDWNNHPKFKELSKNYITLIDELVWFQTDITLSNQERKCLCRHFNFKLPCFYVLPKLHKWKNKNDLLSSRPIAGVTKWFTTPISILLDTLLQPKLVDKPWILKNSFQLTEDLNNIKIRDDINNYFLVTLDVTALYPNIKLEKLYNEVLNDNPTLQQMARFIFENNFLEYNDKVFRQKNGIAMGTNCAVSIANLYLAVLLDPLFLKHNYYIKLFRRYIDDIFLLWRGSLRMLLAFVDTINKSIDGIHLTINYSKEKVEFLDLDIRIIGNQLVYSVFQKELNKYMYLTPKSCHPKSTLKGFIRGEFIRYKRLSLLPSDLAKIKLLFKIRLLARGYPILLINQALTIPPRSNKTKTVLPVIIRYSLRTNLPNLPAFLKRFQYSFCPWIKNSKLTIAFSKSQNITGLLSRPKLTPAHKEILRNTPSLSSFEESQLE